MNQVNTVPNYSYQVQNQAAPKQDNTAKDGGDFGKVMKKTIEEGKEQDPKEQVIGKSGDKVQDSPKDEKTDELIASEMIPLIPIPLNLENEESAIPKASILGLVDETAKTVAVPGELTEELVEPKTEVKAEQPTVVETAKTMEAPKTEEKLATASPIGIDQEAKSEKSMEAPVQPKQKESFAQQMTGSGESQERVATETPVVVTKTASSGAETLEKPLTDKAEIQVTAAETTEEKPVEKTEVPQVKPDELMMAGKQEDVVRIKVAEPFRQIDQPVVKQMADQISEKAAAGKQEFNIQLDPEHLGKISIKITVLEDGIKVLLSCDNQKTMSLLADKAAGLGKIVEDNMQNPVVVEVKEDGYWNQQKDATDQQAKEQRQPQQQPQKEETDDFIQQLRLGLFGDRTAVNQ